MAADSKQKQCFEIVPVPKVSRPVSGPSVVLVVKDGRYRVEVGDGFQVQTLRAVLDVLEPR